MGIISSLQTFIKMGCESDSFGGCVLSLEGYRVEGNVWAHTLPSSQYVTITDAVHRSIPRLLLRIPARVGTGQKALLVLCTLSRWGLSLCNIGDRSGLNSLPSGTGGSWKASKQWKLSCCYASFSLKNQCPTLATGRSKAVCTSSLQFGTHGALLAWWLEMWPQSFLLFFSFHLWDLQSQGMKVSKDKQVYVEPATWQRTGHFPPGTHTWE